MKEDTFIIFGDAIKALDDKGAVGGYAVRFTDENHKDLDGDFFDTKSYLGPNSGNGSECLFDHGFPLIPKKQVDDAVKSALTELADRTFAPVKTKVDAVGVWAETVLDLADEYESYVHKLVKKNKLGWSSGASGHRVKRESNGRLARWPIAEISFTPRPAEPMNRITTVKSLKSIKFVSLNDDEDDESDDPTPTAKSLSSDKSLASRLTRLIDDLVDEGKARTTIIKSLAREALCDESDVEAVLDGTTKRPSDAHLKAFSRVLSVSVDQLKEIAGAPSKQTIKGMFAEKMAEHTPSRWELDSVLCTVVKDVATIAKASATTGTEFDQKGKVKEIVSEHGQALESLINSQISDYVLDGSDEPFYLKSVSDLSGVFESIEGLAFDEHSQLVVSALTGIVKRFGHFHQTRIKAGRVLSEKTRSKLSALLKQILSAVADGQKLLEESQPMATDAEKRMAQTAFLRLQQRVNKLGATTNG